MATITATATTAMATTAVEECSSCKHEPFHRKYHGKYRSGPSSEAAASCIVYGTLSLFHQFE